jgi:dephospho-CoA kinase
MKLVVLTGASGSGKTAIARAVAAHEIPGAPTVLHFDATRVPSQEEMVREYGSGEAWQEQKTFEWLRRIRLEFADRPAVLFEGQSRIAFIRAAIERAGIEHAEIILVDCDDETRFGRLRLERSQPDLATQRMLTWAAYLRTEAARAGIPILDTTDRTIADSVDYVLHRLAEPTS